MRLVTLSDCARQGSLAANLTCSSMDQSACPKAEYSERVRADGTVVTVSPPSRSTASTACAAAAGAPSDCQSVSAAELSE